MIEPYMDGDGELIAHYGRRETALEIDHKGRVFVHMGRLSSDESVVCICNEADDAIVYLGLLINLARRRLRFLKKFQR